MTRVAVIDDWQRVAAKSADWSRLKARAEVVFFHTPFADADEVVAKLADFDIVLSMRERTALPASLTGRLPKLRMLGITGARAASIDSAALQARGITVCYTGAADKGEGTAELALGLMLSGARHIGAGEAAVRSGRFQEGVPAGFMLSGKTLGVIGLGRLGSLVARYAQALGMQVLAWSQNLTAEKATAAGATLVPRDELLARADVITLHLVLSERTRGIIGAAEIARMRQGVLLVNTSRGPLIDEAALLQALRAGKLMAALDVYDREPLPPNHPFMTLSNVAMTPHLGYGTLENFAEFYRQCVENVLGFLDGKPVRVLAPAKT